MRLGETLVKAIAMLCRCLTRGRDIINIKMKWAVVVLALATVVGLGVLMIQRATELNSDFITYRAAGWAVLTGSDIYEVQNPRGWPYVYPPRDGVGLCRVAEGVSVDGHLAASSMT